jgi:cephalosporin hydroxylase
MNGSEIDNNFDIARKTVGNHINEHIDTLYWLTLECDTVIECGVETVISSWAFSKGLRDGNLRRKILGKGNGVLISIDLNYHPSIYNLRQACAAENVDFTFKRGSDLDVELPSTVDMVFIDTFHVYGQLWRELARFGKIAQKYIVMHDTVVDGKDGETIRRKWNPIDQMKETGYPLQEIMKGLWPAVEEFIAGHPEWRIKKHYTNCNGLTVLERINTL